MRLERENFEKEIKKLKKHNNELEMLEKILVHIKQTCSYDDLCCNPISRMYGFEVLKYEMCGYHSFNLCKKGGVIRLICKINKEDKSVSLEYISMNHYEDFKEKIKRENKKSVKI